MSTVYGGFDELYASGNTVNHGNDVAVFNITVKEMSRNARQGLKDFKHEVGVWWDEMVELNDAAGQPEQSALLDFVSSCPGLGKALQDKTSHAGRDTVVERGLLWRNFIDSDELTQYEHDTYAKQCNQIGQMLGVDASSASRTDIPPANVDAFQAQWDDYASRCDGLCQEARAKMRAMRTDLEKRVGFHE